MDGDREEVGTISADAAEVDEEEDTSASTV